MLITRGLLYLLYNYNVTLFFLCTIRRDSSIDTNLDTVAAGVVTAVRIPVRLNNAASEPAVAPVVSLEVPTTVGFISAFQAGSVS